MTKAAFLLSTLAITANAATKVAVLEFGSSSVVRRTISTRTESTFSGVVSFWSALHGRQLQQAGMPLVPDMFNKADHALILGISGADFDTMPNLAKIVDNRAVGHMDVEGAHCKEMVNKFGPPKETSVDHLVADARLMMTETGVKSVSLEVNERNSVALVSELQTLIAAFEEQAKDGKSRVLHLVIEDTAEPSHRRLESRDLADVNAVSDPYGDYNDYGVWVTPYKTMFQIQYFNVVLWTSLGLVLILISTVYMMIDMPLEADTLLFGESAKMMGE